MNKVPTTSELIKSVFDALKQLGGSGTNKEINQIVSQNLKLPKEITEKMHKDMSRTELEYNLQWARTNLKNANYIENSKRGVWNIVSSHIEDSIDEYKVKEITKKRANVSKIEINSNIEKLIDNNDLIFDKESLEICLKEDAKKRLNKLLSEMDPFAFERLSKRLLREMGFEEVNVTAKAKDGGIDGFGKFKINGILTFNIAFQCKRYQGTVPTKDIRDFRGSLSSNIEKGVFITTGTYSEAAKQEATAEGKMNIDLVDGDELIEKLFELEIGIKEIKAYDIDVEFFSKVDN